jgi:stalled ribosome rescue protein Dom34
LGPKRNEVTGGWRKLHNEELHNLYTLANIIRMIKDGEIVRACSTYGEEKNAGKARRKETTRKTRV